MWTTMEKSVTQRPRILQMTDEKISISRVIANPPCAQPSRNRQNQKQTQFSTGRKSCHLASLKPLTHDFHNSENWLCLGLFSPNSAPFSSNCYPSKPTRRPHPHANAFLPNEPKDLLKTKETTPRTAAPTTPNPAYNRAMTGRAPGRLHGDDLIGEVLRNMQEGTFRIRRKTLVPAIYRIYLHPDDYEPFRDVVPFIAGEIRAALDEKLSSLNRTPRQVASSLIKKIRRAPAPVPQNEFVRVSDAWTVEIYPDLDEKLQPGEIEVHSELGAPQKAEYGAGSLTRRIIPQKAEAQPVAQPVDSAPTIATAVPEPPSQQQADPAEEDKTEQTKGLVFAYLRYADQEGQKAFEVTKNQVVIGRGGRSYWVDVKLETLPDVSREHCRIRRDPETGQFTVEDVSQFGTAVNGKPVGRNTASDLPRRATISLAGVIDLQWEAL
jgi:hypothetical protein